MYDISHPVLAFKVSAAGAPDRARSAPRLRLRCVVVVCSLGSAAEGEALLYIICLVLLLGTAYRPTTICDLQDVSQVL